MVFDYVKVKSKFRSFLRYKYRNTKNYENIKHRIMNVDFQYCTKSSFPDQSRFIFHFIAYHKMTIVSDHRNVIFTAFIARLYVLRRLFEITKLLEVNLQK